MPRVIFIREEYRMKRWLPQHVFIVMKIEKDLFRKLVNSPGLEVNLVLKRV
jgi:hypothetical protein